MKKYVANVIQQNLLQNFTRMAPGFLINVKSVLLYIPKNMRKREKEFLKKVNGFNKRG